MKWYSRAFSTIWKESRITIYPFQTWNIWKIHDDVLMKSDQTWNQYALFFVRVENCKKLLRNSHDLSKDDPSTTTNVIDDRPTRHN